jgi:DNA-binding transcriptional ArsR family regulator
MPYLEANLHGWKGGDGTGYEAALDAAATSEAKRQAVLDLLAKHPEGLTTHEIAARLLLPVPSIQPRVSELRNLKRIEATGARRRNASGMSAAVFRLPA